MPGAARKKLFLGAKLFALAVASTAALSHKSFTRPTNELNTVSSGQDVSLQTSTTELWQGKAGIPSGALPKLNRETSFAGSVGSTESMMSITTYIRRIQARIRPRDEREVHYGSSPRRTSIDQSMNLDITNFFL